MRVPTRSAGTRSGVNCTRLKLPPRTWASVLTVSVLARPGTPSSSTWPPARRATSSRSSIASWPTMMRFISKRASSSTARGSSPWCVAPAGGGGGGGKSVTFGLQSLDDPPEVAERHRGTSEQQQQATAGEGRRDLALLLLLAQLRAEALVDGLEAAGGVGPEELAARRTRDLLECARIRGYPLGCGASAESLRALDGDRALRGAERHRVDRDLQLAGSLRRRHRVATARGRTVGEQHDRGGRALLADAGCAVQRAGGGVDRLAGRGAAGHAHAVDRGAHGLAVLRRALQHPRHLVERHHADVQLLRHVREDLNAGALGGYEAIRRDFAGRHRAGD